MKYFRIRPDMTHLERWVLGDIRHVNNWLLIDPPVRFMEPGTFELDVLQQGEVVDYSLAGYASVPVVSATIRAALAGLPEVDEPYMHVVMEPVLIEGQDTEGSYFVMIVETRVDCIDESRSEFEKFKFDDLVRPDLAGQFNVFTRLVLDVEKVGPHHIFRLEGYSNALIVSEEVKRRLDLAGAVGVAYEEVSG